MAVYAITLGVVLVLCIYAENADFPIEDLAEISRIRHSRQTLELYCGVIIVLALVSGLRYRVGADYMAYYLGYGGYVERLPEALKTLDEPGLGIISFLATKVIDDGATTIFFASLITVGLFLMVLYRHTDELLFSTYLYITMGCWYGSFNGIRQYLAITVLFCGYRYLVEKNLIKFFVVVFIAFLFHRSAIVMIVLYFLFNKEINIRNIVIIIIVTGVLLFSFERMILLANFIMDKNYNPMGGYTSHRVNRLRVLSACIPAVVFLIEYMGKRKTEMEAFFLNITIVYAAFCIFTMNSALLYRISSYITPFMLIAIPELLKGVSDNNRKVLNWGFSGMYFVMWWYEISISADLNNFQFIWNR